MKKQAPYDPVKDFTPIAIVARVPLVFVVNSKFAPSSLAELIAYAKAKPDAVRYGSAGVGSLLHLGVEHLVASTGTQMLHVPYKGGGPMMQDIVAGQIELVVTAADFTKRFVDSGQLKALAVADSTRHPLIPNVPTTAEVGMPDLLVVSWFGILGPANVPRPIIDAVAKELASVMGEATLKERLLQVGASATYEPPAEYARHIAEEQRRWTRLVKDANIPLQD
jgi:tripartite-type tricarboxylate transporter receptor subunit TctC